MFGGFSNNNQQQGSSFFGSSNNSNNNNNSGFGSPFGTSSNVNANQQQQQQTSFGTPFGASQNVVASSGFGSSSNTAVSPFGQSSQVMNPQQQSSTFASPFGQSSNIATPATNTGFGQSSNTTNMNNSGPFGQQSNTNTAPSTGFGTSTTTFGSSSNTTSSFGVSTSTSTNNANTGFGASTTTSGFGSSSNTMQSPSGASQNTAQNTGSIFGQATTTSSSGTTGASTFGNPFTPANTSQSNSFATPFGTATTGNANEDNDDMGDDDNNGHFGNQEWTPSTSTSTTSGNREWVAPSSTANHDKEEKQKGLAALKAKLQEKRKKVLEMKMRQIQEQKQEQEENQKGLNPNANAFVPGTTFSSTQATSSETLFGKNKGTAGFQAFQSRKAGRKTPNASNDTSVAPSYETEKASNAVDARIPRKRKNKKHSQQQHAQGDDIAAEEERQSALAAKNAQRFAKTQNRTSINMLPQELQQSAKSYDPSSSNLTPSATPPPRPQSTSEPQGNLVGLCPHMCPDEELIRREGEGNIQLLEMPHETIHPKEWTLRNTCVKRFRRSAADFKLDIPELVRPPHVLETTCAYLEEWLMERDRQGVDARYVNNPIVSTNDGMPPSLDVYQFIWDRTRMIRKDFILQNYTGTSGRCNAVAVRCHERIARWHALVEHQLSHLDDFVKMQSQQNIQELGATMKSLNMFYDDAAKRSTVEGEDVDSNILHGCQSNVVLGGQCPKDYDGRELVNAQDSSSISNRIIGNSASGSGTAEPEMRGLYILLTINNDGGMEVLKYAARLSRDRPEIFNSKPVQLAMQVYKARKDYNYAKFFSILRDPSTPYLFACIMFKYVETMRKTAFRIMSRTFGVRRKDTGESIYDHYPLQDLVHLLCFENLEEARKACDNYNITVKSMKVSEDSDQAFDIVFWRKTDFKEPRDPEKGTLLHLRPWKMNRVIESKLGGTTRLGICRGEVSGAGATLDPSFSIENTKRLEEAAKLREEKRAKQQLALEEARRKELLMKKKLEMMKMEKEKKAREERERLDKIAQIKAAEDEARKREQEIALQKQEREREEQRRRGLEQQRKLQEEEDLRQRKIKEERARKERIAQVEQMKRDEEARKLKEEQERQERVRKEAEAKRLREEEEARLRKLEEERLRKAELERMRQFEQERIRKAKEEEQKRIEAEWKAKTEMARKLFVMKKLASVLDMKRGSKDATKATIESLNLLRVKPIDLSSLQNEAKVIDTSFQESLGSKSLNSLLYQTGTDTTSRMPVEKMLFESMVTMNSFNSIAQMKLHPNEAKNVVLLQIGILIDGSRESIDLDLVRMWIDHRLQLNQVHILSSNANEVRCQCSCFDSIEDAYSHCDAILVILADESSSSSLGSSIMGSTPVYSFSLEDCSSSMQLDNKLWNGCNSLVKSFANSFKDPSNTGQLRIIEKHTLSSLSATILRKSLQSFANDYALTSKLPSQMQRLEKEIYIQDLILHCINALVYLFENICELSENNTAPQQVFFDESELLGYFGNEEGLPYDWQKTLIASSLQDAFWNIFPSLLQEEPSLEEFLSDILSNSPLRVQQECARLHSEGNLVACLDTGLRWKESQMYPKDSLSEYTLYLPAGRPLVLMEHYLASRIQPKDTEARIVYEYDNAEELNEGLDQNEDYSQEEEEEEEEKEDNEVQDENQDPYELAYPSSSTKRQLTVTEQDNHDFTAKKKRNKVDSEELIQSREFTSNLERIANDTSGIQDVIGNPLFARLIASDESLQSLVRDV